MALIILQFDQLMALPVDATGLTITDDNGGTFTSSSVAFGTDNKRLYYTGTWAPDAPVSGSDIVQTVYSKSVGALISAGGGVVESFNVSAAYWVAQPGSIYSGTKDTTVTWTGQVEKLATGVNVVIVEDQTAQILIGFTSDPLVEPATWTNVGTVDPSEVYTTDAYVAWKSLGNDTFTLTQTKAR
jgi:hypothetical protein